MTSDTATEIKMERTLNAPIAHVFDVLTQAEHIPNWFGPSDDYKIEVDKWDCRLGGKYRIIFNVPTEGDHCDAHTVVGTFKEIVPNERLTYTWSWEEQPAIDTLVTFEVRADGDKTHLDFSHTGFPNEEVRGHHMQGWTGSIERLTRAVG